MGSYSSQITKKKVVHSPLWYLVDHVDSWPWPQQRQLGYTGYEMALHFFHWVGVKGPKKSWTSIPILQLKGRIRWYEVLLVDPPLSVGSWTCIFTQQQRGRMRFAFCSFGPAGKLNLPLGSGNRQKEGEWSSTCWQTTLPTRAVSVGLDRVGRAEPLALSGAKQVWFKVVLVNMPLSLHLWCQWVQKDLSLYPPKWQGEWLECKLSPTLLWCHQSHVESWIPIPLGSAKQIYNLGKTKMDIIQCLTT